MIRNIPFARILAPFTAGILVQIWLSPPKYELQVALLIAVLIYSLFVFIPKLYDYRIRFIPGFVLSIAMFALGALVTYYNTVKNCDDYFDCKDKIELYSAVVSEDPVEKNSSYKSILNIKSVKVGDEWKDAKGNVLVYFAKGEFVKKISYGDKLVFKKNPVEVEEPSNPRQFNYKRYLSFHNIYHQVFFKSEDFVFIGNSSNFSLIGYSLHMRDKLLSILRKYIPMDRENSVASALVLGYNDAIDQDLVNAYSSAGAMHVLCVSGLHVGIIFIVLSRMLVFLNKNKLLKILKFCLLLLFIWFYALITGLSPSVLRASTMISLIIIGTWIRGDSNNIYNTLFVSIFVLLFFNPYLITEVGFQLSYLAVFSIVYVHPKIYLLMKSSSFLWNRVWEITSVSISAQLATFPLAALYFNKFPNLFFVSNLFVIPTATIILYGCILLMLFSWIPILSVLIAKLLAGVIWFLNEIVLLIERIPYSVIDGIAWSVGETWLVYSILFFAILFFVKHVPAYLQISLLSLCLLISVSVYKSHFISKQNKIVIYNVNKSTAIDFISGNTNYLLADKKLITDDNAIRFHILQNWFWMGAKENNLVDINNVNANQYNHVLQSIDDQFLMFQNKRIGIIGDPIEFDKSIRSKAKLDLLIVRYFDGFSVNQLLNEYDFKQVVLDSSWPKWKVENIKEEFQQLSINVHAVSIDNAFEWEI